MIFKSESIPSLFIHTLTEIKLKNDDPLKIWFDAIEWTPIHDKCFHLYSDIGAPAYNPVSMFKALLLIYLGQALSERDIAEKLKFDVRLQSLCGFDFFDTPSHVSFHDFRERLGAELFHDILHQLIAQAIAVGVIKNVIHDDTDVYKHCVEKDIHPIIALNPRNQKEDKFSVNPKVDMDKDGCFFCSITKFRLIKNGTEPKRKDRLKLICPPTREMECPFRESCCPHSKVGRTFYLYPLRDIRLLGTIPRDSDEWKSLYRQRTAVERTNSLLKSLTSLMNQE